MDNVEKAQLTASIRHIAKFLKQEIVIYTFQAKDTDKPIPGNNGNCKALCFLRSVVRQML